MHFPERIFAFSVLLNYSRYSQKRQPFYVDISLKYYDNIMTIFLPLPKACSYRYTGSPACQLVK